MMDKPKKSNKKKGKEPTEHDDDRLESTARSDEDFLQLTNADNEQKENDNEHISEKNHEKHDDKHSQENENQSDGGKEHAKIEHEGHNMYNTINIYIFFVILPIVIMAALGLFHASSSIDSIDIESSLKQLANDFQNQSPSSFKKLKSRVLAYIHHRTSPQPFVLLVASTQDNQLTAECFARRVAILLGRSSVAINGSKYLDTASDDAKLDIDNRLRNVFRKGNFPTSAIIHNLDSIPYGTTNLFYAYCDHDNPVYKEAAIIFTITLPQRYQISTNEVHREGLVEKYLSEDSPWIKDSKFSMDVMGALISRITDIVIVVNKESKEALEKSC